MPVRDYTPYIAGPKYSPSMPDTGIKPGQAGFASHSLSNIRFRYFSGMDERFIRLTSNIKIRLTIDPDIKP